MKNYHQEFEDFLKTQNSRYTSQKKEIVEEIAKLDHHFEVDDFIAAMRKRKHPFSRATVYRTIKHLFDAGLIQKISTKDGKVYYEENFTHKQHDHIICNHCGKILEIRNEKINKIVNQQCKEMAFIPSYRSMHIYGVCKSMHETGVCGYDTKGKK